MRILIIARDFAPDVGGVQNLLASVAKTLEPDTLTVLTRRCAGWRAHDAAAPYRVVRIPRLERYPKLLSAALRGPLLLFWSLRLARLRKPELVIAGYAKGDAPFGWLLKRLFAIPYVVFVYGMEVARYRSGRSPFIGTWLREAALVAAISRPGKEIVEALTQGKARVEIVPLGCGVSGEAPDLPLTHWAGTDLGAGPVLLSVCRLTPRKGVDRVIEAVALLSEQYPELIYAIVGDGDDRGRLTGLVRERGLERRVLFAGRVSDADLLRFYARCDLLVLASREERDDFEGFGLVFVEAGAFGKPVIGGDSGGVSEAVAHEENGLLVDPQSPQAIAEAVRRILGDRELALRLGKEGKRRATEVFTWERCRQAVIAALGERSDTASRPPRVPS